MDYNKTFRTFAQRDVELLRSFAGAVYGPENFRAAVRMRMNPWIQFPTTSRAYKWFTNSTTNTPEGRKALKAWLKCGEVLWDSFGFPSCCGSIMLQLKDVPEVERMRDADEPFNTEHLRKQCGNYETPYSNMMWLVLPQRLMEYAAPTLLDEGWHLISESSNIEVGAALFIRDTVKRTAANWKAANKVKRRKVVSGGVKSEKNPSSDLLHNYPSIARLSGFNHNRLHHPLTPDNTVEFQLCILRDYSGGGQIPLNLPDALANGWEVCSHDGEPYFNGRYLPSAHFLLPLMRRNPNYDPPVDR